MYTQLKELMEATSELTTADADEKFQGFMAALTLQLKPPQTQQQQQPEQPQK